MPQRGARGSPLTDLRKVVTPARATAAATVAPRGTSTTMPFTVIATSFVITCLRKTRRQVWFRRNRRRDTQNRAHDQLGGTQRGRDSQTFVSRSQQQPRLPRNTPNKWQLIRSSRAKPR